MFRQKTIDSRAVWAPTALGYRTKASEQKRINRRENKELTDHHRESIERECWWISPDGRNGYIRTACWKYLNEHVDTSFPKEAIWIVDIIGGKKTGISTQNRNQNVSPFNPSSWRAGRVLFVAGNWAGSMYGYVGGLLQCKYFKSTYKRTGAGVFGNTDEWILGLMLQQQSGQKVYLIDNIVVN